MHNFITAWSNHMFLRNIDGKIGWMSLEDTQN